MKETKPFELIGHSRQIADTGDYDGCWEITNGKVQILTNEGEDEDLQPVVDALNGSGCQFYLDDSIGFENHLLKEQVKTIESHVVFFAKYCVEKGISEINEQAYADWIYKEIVEPNTDRLEFW